MAGTAPTTTPSVFVDQPIPLPETFGFVSLLGLALAPDNNSLYTSDFAGGIRQYDLTGSLLQTLSTNYTATSTSNNFIGSLTFGTGSNSTTLYSVGFDFSQNNLGSILSYTNGVGSETSFTGSTFTNSNLSRPIGVTAVVPEPSTMAGVVLGLAGLAATKRRKRSQQPETRID